VRLEGDLPDRAIERRAQRPGDPVERRRVDSDGRRQHGHVARQRLEHGKAEALVGGRHEDGVGGVDVERHLEGMNAPERQESRVAGDLLRAVEALARARRVGREEQAGLVGRQAQALARLGARDRGEAIEVDAARQHGHAAAAAGAGHLARELGADRRHEVDERQRRARDPARARVAQVGAVEGHDVLRARQRERGPRGEAEVGVDDVEALVAIPAAQRAGGAQVAAGREGEDLDVDAFDLAQRVDLVAHEAAQRRLGRRGPHVRDDEGTHSGVILHSSRLSPSQPSPETRSR
jgi:hypothetical protein